MGNSEGCSACGGERTDGAATAYAHTEDCRIARRLADAEARRALRDRTEAPSLDGAGARALARHAALREGGLSWSRAWDALTVSERRAAEKELRTSGLVEQAERGD